MAANDQAPDGYPDALTPDQQRRFQLWRATAQLAQAQADGRLTVEQTRLLTSLADSLQQLAVQLGELAALGQQCVDLLDRGRVSPVPPPDPGSGPP